MLLPNIPLNLEEWRQQTSPAIQEHLEHWEKQTSPGPGRFVFDMTLFGKDVDNRIVPLLRVSNLYFE